VLQEGSLKEDEVSEGEKTPRFGQTSFWRDRLGTGKTEVLADQGRKFGGRGGYYQAEILVSLDVG